MRAQNAVNTKDVLSAEESAQPTSRLITKKSGKPCRLLCDPRNLLKPPYSQPKIPVMTKEQERKVKDYFSQRYVRLEGVARDKGWIR